MKKVLDENVIPLFQEEQKPQDSAWRRSIPAQVFLNYFFAINYHISHSSEESGLRNNAFFRQHSGDFTEQDLGAIARILHNSWSTEYALRATAELGDETYLRNALHWTFPQAYYSIFAGLQAFLYTLGTKTNNEAAIRREAGRLVVKNAYPRAIGYYAAGPYNDYSIHRLPLAGYKAGLQIAGKEIEAQAQIGQFLRTTRKLTANAIRQQVQKNPATAIKSSKTGKVLDKWAPQHWQQITWRMGYTTLFDLLSRLRISSTQKEIERFVEAEIDFKLFHECLLSIVSYMNGLHETYVAQALGLEKYRKMVAELPEHLSNSFVENRLRAQVEPLFLDGAAHHMAAAA